MNVERPTMKFHLKNVRKSKHTGYKVSLKLPLICKTESLHPNTYTDCFESQSSIIKFFFPIWFSTAHLQKYIATDKHMHKNKYTHQTRSK